MLKHQISINGYTTMDQKLSADQILNIRNDIKFIFRNKNRYNKIWIDEFGSDHRIFGFENICQSANSLKERLDSIMNSLYGQETDSTFLAQLVLPTVNNKGSGGTWHRDSLRTQYKAFVYLNDVNLDSGCLDYADNTFKSLNKLNELIISPNRFQIRLDRPKFEPKKFASIFADEGEIILADTSAIHRGHNNLKKERLNLTLYSYRKNKMPPHIKSLIQH